MDVGEYLKSRARMVENKIYSWLPEEPREVYGMLREYISWGGKRIRPVLALASCYACGGREEDVMPFAAAIEMFHNFTLIHDDIEDSSPMRRGRPTLHMKYGVPIAINSGDALYNLVWDLLAREVEGERFRKGAGILIGSFKAVAEGQGIELNWYREGRFDVSEGEYLMMISGKTASLIGASCEIGAYCARAEDMRCAMLEFGESIGLAFQIKDDVLNLTADPSKYQKKIGEDIDEGKRSMIMIHLLASLKPEARREVIRILAKEKKSDEEREKIIRLAKEHGSIKYASDYAEKLVRKARRSLGAIENAEGKRLMESLADYIVNREK